MTAQETRPLHLQPRLMTLVLLGGLFGTPARYAVALALPHRSGHWPTGTFVVNLVGAFALGFLLETLDRTGPDTGGRRRLRLLLGTGFMGAFTTYSTLAVDADLLVHDHHASIAVAYAITSLVCGLGATVLGLACAGRATAPLGLDPDTA